MKTKAHHIAKAFSLFTLLGGILLLAQGLLIVTSPQVAEAGVLVKRVSIRNSHTPRAHTMRAKESTAAARRTTPSMSIKTDTERSIVKIQKQRAKYLKQLHRWQQQKARTEQRARQKQMQQLQTLAREQEREKARLARKKRGGGFGFTSSAPSSPEPEVKSAKAGASAPRSTVTVGKRTESGKPSLFERERPKDTGAKKGILSHFWKALFG